MPDFHWEALSANGQRQSGQHSAASVAEVVQHLRKSRLSPIKVQEASAASTGVAAAGALPGMGPKRLNTSAIKSLDIHTMTTELAIMMRAGLSLDNALKVLLEMSHKQRMQEMLQAILDGVKGGMPLSQALQQHPRQFGDFYVNMVRSGEVSGQMSAVLVRLSEHMQRQRALRESAISATIYPAILLGVALLSLVAMLGFVVPQFEQLFTDMGDALPLPTQWVMALGHAFQHYGLYILAVLALLAWQVWRWAQSPAGRQTWQGWLLRLPVLGRVLHKYQITLYSRSLGTLLVNGVGLLVALRIASETVDNHLIRSRLEQIAPLVKQGQRLVQAVTHSGQFEPLALNLVRVGEETGSLGDMMLQLSDILNQEVETGIKRLLTLLEPALILVLGLLIAAIIISILLGILSVNDLAG